MRRAPVLGSLRNLLACLALSAFAAGSSFGQSLGNNVQRPLVESGRVGLGCDGRPSARGMFLTFFIYCADARSRLPASNGQYSERAPHTQPTSVTADADSERDIVASA